MLCLVAQSCPIRCDPLDCGLPGSSVHRYSPGKKTGVGSHALLQGIFPTQGSNPGLPHCRQILLLSEPRGRPFQQEVMTLTRGCAQGAMGTHARARNSPSRRIMSEFGQSSSHQSGKSVEKGVSEAESENMKQCYLRPSMVSAGARR